MSFDYGSGIIGQKYWANMEERGIWKQVDIEWRWVHWVLECNESTLYTNLHKKLIVAKRPQTSYLTGT